MPDDIWSDCFGGGGLDYTRWETKVHSFDGIEKQFYTNRIPKLPGGERLPGAGARKNRLYTSSRVRTQHRGDWRYGMIEFRALLPGSLGCGLPSGCCCPLTTPAFSGASYVTDIVERAGRRPGETNPRPVQRAIRATRTQSKVLAVKGNTMIGVLHEFEGPVILRSTRKNNENKTQ